MNAHFRNSSVFFKYSSTFLIRDKSPKYARTRVRDKSSHINYSTPRPHLSNARDKLNGVNGARQCRRPNLVVGALLATNELAEALREYKAFVTTERERTPCVNLQNTPRSNCCFYSYAVLLRHDKNADLFHVELILRW